MKYHQDFASARALASHWWHHHGHQRLPLDALVPVPLHRHKARHRGFNQSEWLARYLATSAGIDVWTGLIKAIPTQPLEGLNRTQRRQTLRGVFTVTQPPPKRVAIVDDVLTTGATAAELARTLKRAGTQHIELWTLARTPLGDG
jgi:ComF family protein